MNRTTQRTMDILKYIGSHPQGVCLQDIAEDMDIPKSSAFVILQTLVQMNYVAPHRENEKRYSIGIETFTLGMRYAVEMNLTKETAHYLAPLAEKYGKTGFVGIADGTDVVYLQKYKSSQAVLATCDLGSRKALHTTALGKSILAFMSPTEFDRLASSIKYEKITSRTISDESDLRQQLADIRQQGYALDVQENNDLLMCCAAPIFDYTKKVVAAISLSDMFQEGEDMVAQARELKAVAEKISYNLGFSGL